jgi:regulatory protein
MARRRGARAGRGWDAIPPRPAAHDSPDGGPRRGSARSIDTGVSRAVDRGRGSSAGEGSAPGNRNDAELAREICLRQLAARPRTRAELAQALARRHIDDEVITEVLDRYDEVGIIDDAAFARAWVSSRHTGRGLARRALAGELRQRGVAGDLVGEALGTLDDEQEAATARALVDRKLRTATGPPEAVFRRLVGMLARKGYPAGLAISAVKDALAARDAEAAEFAEQIDPDALADATVEPAPAGEIGEPGGMRDI